MLISIYLIYLSAMGMINAQKMNTNLVQDYFEKRGTPEIIIFGCWKSDYEKVSSFREMAPRGPKLSFTQIFDGLKVKDFLKVNYYKLGVFLDLDCSEKHIVLNQIQLTGDDDWSPFNESYLWLMQMSAEQQRVPVELLELLPLSVNAELTLAMGRELYDVYNPSYRHNGRLNVTRMGHWSKRDGVVDLLASQYKYKRRANLNGMTLNFSVVLHFLPETMDMVTYLSTPTDRHFDTLHRYSYGLIVQLMDYYNFTINLLRTTSWGYLINGTFDGAIGDMIKGMTEVSVTPFTIKRERLDVLEFTTQVYLADLRIIFRHPKKQELNNKLLEPFSREVWFLTFIVGLLNWLIFYISIKMELRIEGGGIRNSLYEQPGSETFLITTAAISQQGLSDTPRLLSSRIVFMSLFLWALLLYQFYSASIVGSLLSEKPRFIKNLKDLTASSLDVGLEDMPYNMDHFRLTTDKDSLELFDRKIAVNKKRKTLPIYSVEEGLRRVKRGNFAFQTDMATAYKFITETFDEDEICELHEIELFAPRDCAIGTRKHSPFKKLITYGLRQIIEHGMSRRLYSVWRYRKPQCPKNHQSTPVPVNLIDFSPALIMLVAAAPLTLFIMLIENLVEKHKFQNQFLSLVHPKRKSTFSSKS